MNKKEDLNKRLAAERAELSRLLAEGRSLADKEVYQKSCQLDKLIVKLMQARST